MDNTIFWEIINTSKLRSGGNLEAQAEFIKQQLSELSTQDIIQFEITLCQLLIETDDYKIIAALRIIDGGVTDDPYLYFRCWLIGQGFNVYTKTLLNPDFLAEIVDKTTNVDFEALLYVADDAYNEKNDSTEESDGTPRDVAFNMGLDYDNSETKGEDWDEEDLPSLLPKLWEKFA